MDENKLKEIFGDTVKDLHMDLFQREISDEELNNGFKDLFSRMKEDLMEVRDFSKLEFDRYMKNKRNELMFSPTYIHKEIKRIISEGKTKELANSQKFKRLREMEVATRLCFANYKLNGETFMILAQDSPDIALALTNQPSKNIEVLYLEVMTVPQNIKSQMMTNLAASLANFIIEKKFHKSYGRCSLMINFDFNMTGLKYVDLTNILQNTPDNPYESIWLAFVSDLFGQMTVIQVCPKTYKVDYNLNKENLYY